MATRSVHVAFERARHDELSEAKGDATWREVIEAGVEVVGDE
jgi:hypothetical protein